MHYTLEESDFIGQAMINFLTGGKVNKNDCSSKVLAYFDNMLKDGKLILEDDCYKAHEKFIENVSFLKSLLGK